MTKRFNQTITCPFCKHEITVETDHDRWMRGHELLDSVKAGFVITDCDHISLRYKRDGSGRDVQTMMVVEIKQRGRGLEPAQAEIFEFLSESMRRTVYPFSSIAGKRIKLLNFGAHRLLYENTDARNSKWIKWDGRLIDRDIEATLLKIFRMDVLPHAIDQSMDEYL